MAAVLRRVLTMLVACLALHARAQSVDWTVLPGKATDISISAKGHAWIAKAGTGTFAWWTGSGWSDTNGAGYRIAANDNTVGAANEVLAVDRGGQLYRHVGSWGQSGPWAKIQVSSSHGLVDSKAWHLSIGSNGAVWLIGTNGFWRGDYQVYRWNGGGWDAMEQGGQRIAVDPAGNAWIVNGRNEVYRWYGKGFTQVQQARAKEIAVGADDTMFVIGLDDALWLRGNRTWIRIPGNAAYQAVAVDPNGNPWAVQKDGTIVRGVLKLPPQPVAAGASTLRKYEYLRVGAHLLSADRRFFGTMEKDGRFCIYGGADPSSHRDFRGCVPREPQPIGDYRMEMRDDGALCILRGMTEQSTWCSVPGGERGGRYYARLEGRLSLYRSDPPFKSETENLAYNWENMSRGSQSPWVRLNVVNPAPAGLVTSSEEQVKIACGPNASACSAEYPRGARVRLVAQGMGGGVFREWVPSMVPGTTVPLPDAACARQPATCVAVLERDQNVMARFVVPRAARLTLYPPRPEEAHQAIATVSYGDTREQCLLPASGCEYHIFPGLKVEIVSTPKPGYTLRAGDGPCKGQVEKCTFDMPARDTNAWIVTRKAVTLPTLTLIPAAGVRLTAASIGIPVPGTPLPAPRVICPESCKLVVGPNQEVLVSFDRPIRAWTGACASENREPMRQPPLPPLCRLIMDGDKTVEAIPQ